MTVTAVQGLGVVVSTGVLLGFAVCLESRPAWAVGPWARHRWLLHAGTALMIGLVGLDLVVMRSVFLVPQTCIAALWLLPLVMAWPSREDRQRWDEWRIEAAARRIVERESEILALHRQILDDPACRDEPEPGPHA